MSDGLEYAKDAAVQVVLALTQAEQDAAQRMFDKTHTAPIVTLRQSPKIRDLGVAMLMQCGSTQELTPSEVKWLKKQFTARQSIDFLRGDFVELGECVVWTFDRSPIPEYVMANVAMQAEAV